MENDVLKNKIVPWQEKGRWYHAHITEAGVDTANTDQFVLDNMIILANDTTASLQAGYTLISAEYRINSYSRTGNVSVSKQIVILSTGKCYINLLRPDTFDSLDCDYYFFIVEKNS